VLAFSTYPDGQDNAGELQRTPQRELRRLVEHRAGARNQLRVQHELRKLAQHLDRNLAAIGYPMKQCGGSPMDVGHRPDGLFILDTVSEMGRFGTFGGLF
jgi:hypothetical protein